MKEKTIEQALKIQGFMTRADLDCLWDLAWESIPSGGRAIEIGAWKGRSTYVLGTVCKEKGAVLYTIDTFAGVEDPDSYKNKPNNTNNYSEAVSDSDFFKICWENVRGLPVAVLRGNSQEIRKYLPDGAFDFCFIDGNHNYPVIDDDIYYYAKKIKPGGTISGHDHGNREGPEGELARSDVTCAVDRLCGNDFTTLSVPGVATTIWVHKIKTEEVAK